MITRKDSHGNRIPKPEIVCEYTNNMSGVDLSDQYMAFHMSLRKSMKWWRKPFHILNMILLNAYILNKKYSNNKLSHDDYMHQIADYLIETTMEDCTCLPQRTITPMKTRLLEKHFICKIPQNSTCILHLIQFANVAIFQKMKLPKWDLNPETYLDAQLHITVMNAKFPHVYTML